MAEEREAVYLPNASPSRRYVKSPGNRDGVSQRQAMLEWGLTHERDLWELERAGKLVGIHVGNRVWYSRRQLTELLGEPTTGLTPPALKRRDNGDATKGGQQERFPFAGDQVAA